MKIFISAMANGTNLDTIKMFPEMDYNLMSYYYLKTEKKQPLFKAVFNKTKELMIDSGAHSFQKGAKVEWLTYTKQYAEWIKKNDHDKILGFFEMDIDNIVGYDRVLELRKILDSVSDKIIPVWHKNRGIKDFKEMCQKYKGKIIAITGFQNEDIRDDQYPMFVNMAWDHGCRIHCLGMTRKKVLDKVPFDYVDSSSWKSPLVYGNFKGKKLVRPSGWTERNKIMRVIYLDTMKMQKLYEQKWLKYEDSYKRGL